MNYRDFLKNASKAYCQRAARRIGLTDRLPASKLRHQIVERFLNPAFLKDLVARLNSYERLVLMILAFSCGETGVPFHLFNRKVNQMSRGWSSRGAEILHTLAESGFIFTFAASGMQYHYIVPADLRLLLQEIFAEDMSVTLRHPKETPMNIRNDGFALVRDTFTFLCFASQYGIRQTQQGSIYKHTQKHLLKHFEVPNDTPKVYDRINPAAENPDRLALIFDFCRHQKLIYRQDADLVCSEAGKEWIQKTDPEKLLDIYNHWLEHGMSKDPSVPIAQSIVRILSPEQWVLLSSIQDQISTFAVSATWRQTLYSQLERSLVNHLTYMGGITFAHLGDDVAIQVTDIGRRLFYDEPIENYEFESSFIVQPNHEVLASSYLAPELRWKLNHIAELHQADQMSTYKLSAQSIYNGLRSGFSFDEILIFLQTHSKTGIPQNVEISIKDWAEQYGQIYLMDVMLLRCKNVHIAQEIKTSKQIGRYILGEISPTDFVVSRQQSQKLLALLEKQNYMPLPEVVTFKKG